MKNKSKEDKKELNKYILIAIITSLLVIFVSIFIYRTDLLIPQVDELTVSYISFNNKNTTDMLRMTDIKKMSDNIGQSIINNKYVSFEVTGDSNSKYDIIVDSVSNEIPGKYIKYSLVVGKNGYVNTLDKLEKTDDLGMILYSDYIKKNNKITVRMWIDKSYKGKISNNAFEIKIKPR